MSPQDWLDDLGEPIVITPDIKLTHPDNPNYHDDVEALVSTRRAEHHARLR
jgi:hypothetical protein